MAIPQQEASTAGTGCWRHSAEHGVAYRLPGRPESLAALEYFVPETARCTKANRNPGCLRGSHDLSRVFERHLLPQRFNRSPKTACGPCCTWRPPNEFRVY